MYDETSCTRTSQLTQQSKQQAKRSFEDSKSVHIHAPMFALFSAHFKLIDPPEEVQAYIEVDPPQSTQRKRVLRLTRVQSRQGPKIDKMQERPAWIQALDRRRCQTPNPT